MHKNVIRFDNRPFGTIDEMNEALVNNWNSVISNADHVYHLGDFCWGKKDDWIKYLKLLNGNIHIIKGNHDLKDYPYDVKKYIVEAVDYKEITDCGRHVIMCHYPIMCYKASYNPNCYMLHGHTHVTREQDFVEKWTKELKDSKQTNSDNCGNIINVGCMMPWMEYWPRTLDEIIERSKTNAK
jgi:calcineurin-like phosphoesterase family protein